MVQSNSILHTHTHLAYLTIDANKENFIEDCICYNKWASHIERVNSYREEYKFDSALSNADTIIYTIDLQKITMLTKIGVFKSTVFTHMIVIYNGSFVPTGKGRQNCIVFLVVMCNLILIGELILLIQ